MTREEFAKKIGWDYVFVLVGIINPFFMLPQFWSVASTGKTDGISVTMLLLLTLVQIGVVGEGFFKRMKTLMFSNAVAVTLTISTIVATLFYRI